MNHNLTYQSEGNIINDLSSYAELLSGGKSFELNITIEAIDAVNHMGWFTRQLFLANLFNIHGFFLKGRLEEEQIHVISDLYSKTKFSFLGHWLYPNTISLTNLEIEQKASNNETNLLSRNIRTTVCWNGNEQLTPKQELFFQFDESGVKGVVNQVQKIIQTDFTGSVFGINTLNRGQVGTISIKLEKDMEKVLYYDNHSKGFFVIKDADGSKSLGIGIIVKE